MTHFLGSLLAASIAAMIAGVMFGATALHVFGAMFAALVAIEVSLLVNVKLWARARREPPFRLAPEAARSNAELMALTYLWGAVAMLGVYRLTDLRWQHDWQYAAAMALVAVLLLAYANRLTRAGGIFASRAGLQAGTALTVVQAVAVIGGMVFMLASGKLATTKGDWAANQIFVAGGVSLLVLSGIAAATQIVIARTR